MTNIPCLILSYDHPDLTTRSLQSALKFFAPHRIHLVHNGSEPLNVEFLKTEFPDIHHFVLRENKGFTGGANFGLLSLPVGTPAVLFLTNDCELDSIGNVPQKDGIYAPLILKRRTAHIDSLGGRLEPATGTLRLLKSKDEWISDKNIYIPGSAFLLVGKALKNREPFDENLGTYWEDVDFSLKMAAKGIPLLPLETLRIRHGVGKVCPQDAHYTSYLFQRNRRIVSRRHVSSDFLTQLRLEFTLLMDLLRNFLRAVFHRDTEHIGYVSKILRDSF